ncbi:hypothetical protein FACS1894184_19540 [Clostridia bacterium]|nr:hypothetical protein FACS1894184_19540 [Clostridia bacterium]
MLFGCFKTPDYEALTKKTEHDELSAAERRRYEEIVTIQQYLEDGYPPVKIKDILQTTYFRIRRYATGDPLKLCRFDRCEPKALDAYRNEIEILLRNNTKFKDALSEITKLGFTGKRTAFEEYCRKMIQQLGLQYTPRKNNEGVPIQQNRIAKTPHCVTRAELLKNLWMGGQLDQNDLEYIYKKYPAVSNISDCIRDFREIFREKSEELLDKFISQYTICSFKNLRSFASGLLSDIDAVRNSVISSLNNGFVEGQNNKTKAIMRTMYGRASIKLLRVKVLFGR